jgi:uncharacterized membrane protein
MKEGKRKWIKNPGTDRILLALIVVTGAVLRLWDYRDLPFSFDEFSALFRTRFDHFTDLIEHGVKTSDTHPPGIQVFLYFWVKIFGESEMVVKFPFVIFGVLAIIMTFKVGKLWFNSTVGLFAAAFLSVLQYPVTYSQFARPYASGLFFSLLMVWFWTYIVFNPEKKKLRNHLGFIISASLCTYNHHFTLFLSALVGISGFFFLKRKYLKPYLLSCCMIILLYIPNLPIFYYQLQRSGVGEWLNKPDSGFMIDYLSYILHFSPVIYQLTTIIIILSFVLFTRDFQRSHKFRILAFSWFAVTYLTGYYYSVYVNAVLQYSVLIFVFPFLVIFALSIYREVADYIKLPIVIIFMTAAIFTLVTGRRHYQLQYNSPYKEILKQVDSIRMAYRDKRITTVLNLPLKIREYYDRKYGFDSNGIVSLDSLAGFNDFRRFVYDQQTEMFLLGWSNIPHTEYKLIVEEMYPYLLEKKEWFTGEFYVYSRKRPIDPDYIFPDSIFYTSLNTFDTLTTGWEEVALPYQLTPGVNYKEDKILGFNKDFEYSPKFRAKLLNMIKSYDNELIISVDAYIPLKMANPVIVCEFRTGNKAQYWLSANISDFVDAPLKRLPVYLSVRLADLNINIPETEVWIYFWNKDLSEIYLDDFKVEVREGNNMYYGLYRKL